MAEFLQNYGTWIFIGVMFLLMMRLHGSGMGCGMGGHQHNPKKNAGAEGEKSTKDGKEQSPGCH